ncbi:hypothetical protein OE88DRAFT_1753982 [Heliocybe sulcata]|uniref:DUF4246 domain-containing protein n=1 Tax=Heliocybe sulcata TaxID=5364 RepID=A0A5C3MZ72_9AGAM|nr:hypothetical protein OE88DRAFT_1753982 [Heliocybe sulcata]
MYHTPSTMSESTADIKFPDPFYSQPAAQHFITLVERRMRVFAGEILEKPNWWTKIDRPGKFVIEEDDTDEDIDCAAYAEEPHRKAKADEEADCVWRNNKLWPNAKISDAQLDYIFGWLRWLADKRDARTGTEMMHIPNVYQSYNLISPELREALLKGASTLESVSDAEKDWHPNSNNQVLDLVHPSLYCFYIGKSFVKRPEDGTLHVPAVEEYIQSRVDIASREERWSTMSKQHQWLPTDFSVSDMGEVKCLSYINNLYPDEHKPLYATITSILGKFVPLWDRVLTDVLNPRKPIIQVDPVRWYDGCELPEPRREDFIKQYPGDREAGLDAYSEAKGEWDRDREPVIPEPGPFSPPPHVSRDRVTFTLKGRTIQVIVKMANIVLTPDKPEYAGGSWHVEGMDNERIIATGIYYYDTSNVTESKLRFRTAICDDMDIKYENGDYDGFLKAYGIEGSEGLLNQDLGHVMAKEGKCLAFPNIWQHRVSPFQLVDPSKPGHRKILCFFLVDPTTSILSTSSVPPQQVEWYARKLERVPLMAKLPRELAEMVTDWLKPDSLAKGGLITIEQAKEERLKLMEERASFVIQQNEMVYEMEFNMCEH